MVEPTDWSTPSLGEVEVRIAEPTDSQWFSPIWLRISVNVNTDSKKDHEDLRDMGLRGHCCKGVFFSLWRGAVEFSQYRGKLRTKVTSPPRREWKADPNLRNKPSNLRTTCFGLRCLWVFPFLVFWLRWDIRETPLQTLSSLNSISEVIEALNFCFRRTYFRLLGSNSRLRGPGELLALEALNLTFLGLKALNSETPKCGSGRMWDLGAQGGSANAPARNNAPGGSTARATCAWRKHAPLSSETLQNTE